MKIVFLGSNSFLSQSVFERLYDKYDLVKLSLRDESSFSKLVDADILVNFIGKAHDHKGNASKEEFDYANFEIVKSIFDQFIKSKAKLLIHISSISAIEEVGRDIVLGEEIECKPISWYGLSKRNAELFLLDQNIPTNKKVVILRPTMIHGPGDIGNLGLLFKLMNKGVPYPLAKFDNKRSFLSIDNFSFFLEEIFEHQDEIDSGIYHICDDEPISTNTIIDIISNITNKKVVKLYIPKFLVGFLAIIGNKLKLPLNTKRLEKMTSNLVVSNLKIKESLSLKSLPISSYEGFKRTIYFFHKDKF